MGLACAKVVENSVPVIVHSVGAIAKTSEEALQQVEGAIAAFRAVQQAAAAPARAIS